MGESPEDDLFLTRIGALSSFRIHRYRDALDADWGDGAD
jgi:hypothetical protein